TQGNRPGQSPGAPMTQTRLDDGHRHSSREDANTAIALRFGQSLDLSFRLVERAPTFRRTTAGFAVAGSAIAWAAVSGAAVAGAAVAGAGTLARSVPVAVAGPAIAGDISRRTFGAVARPVSGTAVAGAVSVARPVPVTRRVGRRSAVAVPWPLVVTGPIAIARPAAPG